MTNPGDSIAGGKYQRLGRKNRMKDILPLSVEDIRKIMRKFRTRGFKIRMGE
ncbi:hypothetical protein QUF80_11890 [Desulfococcaceae bacterium HSG8]|nr:hypothetical protein [Desulfococcaceae bacterium HSG8]